MKSGIYTIENTINGKLYVGYGKTMYCRWQQHRYSLRRNTHSNPYLQAAWNKYGEEAFKFEVLVYCEEQFLYSEEHYWCTLLNVHNRQYGYNSKPTNPNEISRKLSEEGREKLRVASKIRSNLPENIEKSRQSMYKIATDPERSAQRKQMMLNRWKDPVIRANYIKSQKSKTKRKTSEKYRRKPIKPVIQYTIEGVFIKEWDSAMEVQRELGIYASSIGGAANPKKTINKTAGGYLWAFKGSEVPSLHTPQIKLNVESVQIIKQRLNEDKCMSNIRKIAADYNVSADCIYLILKNKTWKNV